MDAANESLRGRLSHVTADRGGSSPRFPTLVACCTRKVPFPQIGRSAAELIERPLKCEQQEVVPKRFAHCSDVEVEFQGGVIAEALLPQIMEVFTAEDLYGR